MSRMSYVDCLACHRPSYSICHLLSKVIHPQCPFLRCLPNSIPISHPLPLFPSGGFSGGWLEAIASGAVLASLVAATVGLFQVRLENGQIAASIGEFTSQGDGGGGRRRILQYRPAGYPPI